VASAPLPSAHAGRSLPSGNDKTCHTKKCDVCGKLFSAKRSTRKTCSDACRQLAHRQLPRPSRRKGRVKRLLRHFYSGAAIPVGQVSARAVSALDEGGTPAGSVGSVTTSTWPYYIRERIPTLTYPPQNSTYPPHSPKKGETYPPQKTRRDASPEGGEGGGGHRAAVARRKRGVP